MSTRRDRGVVLPLVLVIVVVLALVIIALANYTSGTLRYGQVVERSGDRLASANAAIDTVLESIDRRSSLCTMSTLANDPDGYTFDLGVPVNGIDPSITCTSIGPPITGIEEYALVLTGAGGTTDGLIEFDSAGTAPTKVIDGPVYVGKRPQSPSTFEVNTDLTIQHGDLLYSNPTCPAPDVLLPGPLEISPATYQDRCVTESWTTLFANARPPEPAVLSLPVAPATPRTDPGAPGCSIWEPGKYGLPPALTPGSYNYFESGDYYFDFRNPPPRADLQLGAWLIDGAYLSPPPIAKPAPRA